MAPDKRVHGGYPHYIRGLALVALKGHILGATLNLWVDAETAAEIRNENVPRGKVCGT